MSTTKILFMSGSIGLGHITRDLAIARELRRRHGDVELSWLAASPADRVITEAGYGQYFTHRTGHGLGLDTHEPPYACEGDTTILEPGMTFTVEPGVYLPGQGGVRVEDDVVITPDGSKSLTTFDRELRVIGNGATRG